MKQVRRYQTRAVEAYAEWIKSDERFASITCPTGTGKTYTACLCLSQHSANKKILWATHRLELVEQAFSDLTAILPNHNIQIEMADKKASPDADIVVGSVQTIARNRKHFDGFEPNIIVIDEAHHVSMDNIQYNGLFEKWPNAKILLLTATPWRSSGEELPLGNILIKMDIGTAVEKGYLVPPKPETLLTDVSLAEVKTKMGDFAIKDLSKAVNVDSRNQLIADRLIKLIREEKRNGILFAVDVEHAKAMYSLVKNEIIACEIYGDTPIDERKMLMEQARNKKINLIINNLVCVEGLDLPHLSFVCVARPTRSLGLFIQMVGRGLRLSEGKKDCIVIDIHDKVKVKQNRVTFSDMAVAGDLYGDHKRAVNILEKEPELDVASKLKNFPIFIKKSGNIDRWTVDEDSFTVSSWSIGQDQWIVTWTSESKQQKIIDKLINAAWKPGLNIVPGQTVNHPTFGSGKIINKKDDNVLVEFGWEEKVMEAKSLSYQVAIKEFSPTDTEIVKKDRLFFICDPSPNLPGRIISFIRNNRDLILQEDKRMEKLEINNYLVDQATREGVLPLVRATAKWKDGPASDKQKSLVFKMMNKIGFDIDIDSLSKGDASAVIDQVKWQELIYNKFGADFKENLLGYDLSSMDV